MLLADSCFTSSLGYESALGKVRLQFSSSNCRYQCFSVTSGDWFVISLFGL